MQVFIHLQNYATYLILENILSMFDFNLRNYFIDSKFLTILFILFPKLLLVGDHEQTFFNYFLVHQLKIYSIILKKN